MGIIELKEQDPIITRAKGLDTPALTEVGFIPNDEFGCKIYASNKNGRMMIIGIHSRTYGCLVSPQSEGIDILPSPVKRCLVD